MSSNISPYGASSGQARQQGRHAVVLGILARPAWRTRRRPTRSRARSRLGTQDSARRDHLAGRRRTPPHARAPHPQRRRGTSRRDPARDGEQDRAVRGGERARHALAGNTGLGRRAQARQRPEAHDARRLRDHVRAAIPRPRRRHPSSRLLRRTPTGLLRLTSSPTGSSARRPP